jgi:hypothetical protein
MKFYFGHKKEITDPFDIFTQQLIFGKPPFVRSQILTQRHRLKKALGLDKVQNG